LDFVAHSPEQFVQIAQRASQDLQRLSALRRELRARMEASPLMDGERFTRGLEAAYRLAWRRWCGAVP
jgi:predicted O-linked N-acetylglucosamine transferase (SPINDLY family)